MMDIENQRDGLPGSLRGSRSLLCYVAALLAEAHVNSRAKAASSRPQPSPSMVASSFNGL